MGQGEFRDASNSGAVDGLPIPRSGIEFQVREFKLTENEGAALALRCGISL